MKEVWVKKLSELAKIKGTPLLFEKDQVLFYQGHQPFGAFLIEDGRVQLLTRAKSGRETVIGDADREDIIGLEELLQNKPYTHTAITLSKSRVSFIPRLQVEKLLNNQKSTKI